MNQPVTNAPAGSKKAHPTLQTSKPQWPEAPQRTECSGKSGDLGKKNRASQSGGDRKARGIFELSTTVGLRRTSSLVCTWNQGRNCYWADKEQKDRFRPKILMA